MGDFKYDFASMTNEELADWIATTPCCQYQSHNFDGCKEIAKRLTTERTAVPDDEFKNAANYSRGYGDGWKDGNEARPSNADTIQAELTAWLSKEMPAGTVISSPAWWAKRIAGRVYMLTAAPQPPEGARVVDGWLFYFADDDGGPHAHYCGTRDEVYAHVAEWMTGDRDGSALSDAGDDMIEGVTATLIDSGAFYPEGDPPCFLRMIDAPTLAGKEGA